MKQRFFPRLIATTCAAMVQLAAAAEGQSPAARGPSSLTPEIQRSFARSVKEGTAASRKGDFVACAAAFERAIGELRQSTLPVALEPALLAELGLCEEALGRSVAAFDHLRLAKENEPAPARGGGLGLWKRVDDALERLRSRVARVIVIVTPPDAEVWVDGTSLGPNVSGRYFTIAPGTHDWSARHPDFEEAHFTHTVRAGDLPDVRLSLIPLKKPADSLCDPACMAAARAHAEADAMSRLQKDFDRRLKLNVQSELELIYRSHVDPSLSLLAGGLMSVGLTLDVGPGFVVGGDARWGAYESPGFSLGVEVRTLLPTKIIEFDTGYPTELSEVTLGAVPCLRYRWMAGCGMADLGLMIPGSRGPLYGAPIQFTLRLGPRLMVDIPFAERFGVRAFGDVLFSPLPSGGYIVDDRVWTDPLVSGVVGVAVSIGQPIRMD